MNIAMISEHASPLAAIGGVDAGGQNIHVAELAAEFVRRGHRVVVYTRRDAPSLPRRVTLPSGVVVEHVDAGPPCAIPKDQLFGFMDEFALRVRRALRRDRPDVVHAHFWMSGYAMLRAAHPLGIPTVHTYHALGTEKQRFQGGADTSPKQRIDCELEILEEADLIIATSSNELFELRRLGGDQRKLRVIPCGVNLAFFDRYTDTGTERRARYRIVTLSRLVERKGIADVVSALRGLPDTELTIGGGGDVALDADPEVMRLRDIAREEGVAGRVHFAGPVPRERVPGFLRSADVVVCTPWYEPFGIVPLEAMACSLPVVASAVGGLNDTIVDGVTGYHVPSRSPGRIAHAVRELLADARLRANLGARGRRRVEARYTWECVAAATLNVYCGLQSLGAHAAEPIHRTA